MKNTEKSVVISVIALIVSAIGVSVSLYAVYYAFELNEPFLVPRDPTLDHIWLDGRTFGKWELETIGEQITKIEVCFYNEGRAPTGHVYAYWQSPYVGPGGLNIDNIPGGETRCERTSIHWRSGSLCEEVKEGDTEMKCNYTLIQNKTQIPLVVECKFCLEPTFYRNFTFCFFDDGVPGDYNCD